MSETITVQAACHCGAFAFEFLHAPFVGPDIVGKARALKCDCTICTTRGYVFIYSFAKDLHFHKGSLDNLTSYRYGMKQVDHLFCGRCGSGVIEKFEGPEGELGVNVRYVRDVDVDALELRPCAGKDDGPGPEGRWDAFDVVVKPEEEERSKDLAKTVEGLKL